MAKEEIEELFARFKDYISGTTINGNVMINMNSDSAVSTINCDAAGVQKTEQQPKQTVPTDYTDEVVARAIMAINGKLKPLCEKQLYLAIIKVLSYKCGWSPLEGQTFHTHIERVWVNGNASVKNGEALNFCK